MAFAATASKRGTFADMDKAAIDVAKALARLSELTIFELRGEWRRLHRMPPPMRFSRDLLTRWISYKLQERAYGGLSTATARKLERASGLVLERLRAFFSCRTDVSDALAPLDLEARALDAALRNAFTLSKRWLAMPPVEMKSLVLDIVERITIAADRIDIWLNRAKIAAALEAGASQRPDLDHVCRSRQTCGALARGSASSSRM